MKSSKKKRYDIGFKFAVKVLKCEKEVSRIMCCRISLSNLSIESIFIAMALQNHLH